MNNYQKLSLHHDAAAMLCNEAYSDWRNYELSDVMSYMQLLLRQEATTTIVQRQRRRLTLCCGRRTRWDNAVLVAPHSAGQLGQSRGGAQLWKLSANYHCSGANSGTAVALIRRQQWATLRTRVAQVQLISILRVDRQAQPYMASPRTLPTLRRCMCQLLSFYCALRHQRYLFSLQVISSGRLHRNSCADLKTRRLL